MSPNLYVAVVEGDVEKVKQLVDRGNINSYYVHGGTPLYLAVIFEHVPLVKLLLAHKDILVDKPDLDGRTPLWDASFYGFDNIACLLLAAKAKVNECAYKGMTPLYAAAQEGRKTTVKLLLANGAAVQMANCRGFSPLHIAVNPMSTPCRHLLPD